ncbi:MAG: hypothetical protein KF690_05320, partial [Bacteroidetes bacterium]|nr:hypothetical protein [Bacteroidota bacterium]
TGGREGLQITSPAEGAEYLMERSKPRKLALEVQGPADAQKFYWFVNGRYLGSVPPGKPLFWAPAAGAVTLEVQDDRGRKAQVRCEVKWF